MMDRYQEISAKLFDMFARREYDEIRETFLAAMRECAIKCAVEAAENPTCGIGQWDGGKISICRELTDGVEGALARAKGEANPDAEAGLAFSPI